MGGMILPNLDFETYSEAGYYFDLALSKWVSIVNSPPHSIGAVGAAVYSEHPSTVVLSAAYDLENGNGPQLWIPGYFPPIDLFNYAAAGGLIEAHNSLFEYFIWVNVCVKKYNWPLIPLCQFRCSASKARAFSLPGKLKDAAKILNLKNQKIEDGDRLIKKFSVPRNPTKNNPACRIHPENDPVDAVNLYKYNIGDIVTERELSAALPELSNTELAIWLADQRINERGVHIDTKALNDCISIVNQAFDRYTVELNVLTGGRVKTASEIKNLTEWSRSQGVYLDSLTAESVEAALSTDLPAAVKRALEIRAVLGLASVKKLYAISRRLSSNNRLKDLFSYCGAGHTGRWAAQGPQPQNLPSGGPASCPEWNIEAIEKAFTVIASRNLSYVESFYGDAVAVVSGCLRGLFTSAEGYDLLCSDYKAIEAVILAELAGETWRQEVFRTHGKIYEMSAAKITGIPFEEFLKYRQENGKDHPYRKSIGKVAELASGYQGGIGAWKKFGADKHLSDDQIKESVAAWRRESPNIVKFWYAMQDCAIAASQNPGSCFGYKGIDFGVKNDILFIKLLSGRTLQYHEPRIYPDVTPYGRKILKISYMGRNNDFKKGPPGWMRLDTYGGNLTENIVQATARDILANAIVNLENAGYPVVLHVHDEICSEVKEGEGSIKEFEKIMSTLPDWCASWPVRAVDSWRGKRYRK
jgi:DNA polymerase